MASLTGRTWVWVNSGSWWWTGRPGVLRFMRSQRVGHDWATDLIWSKQLTHTYKLLIKCVLLRPTVYIWMEDPLLHILQSLDGLIIKYVSSILQLTKPLCMICSVFYFSYILNQVFFFFFFISQNLCFLSANLNLATSEIFAQKKTIGKQNVSRWRRGLLILCILDYRMLMRGNPVIKT